MNKFTWASKRDEPSAQLIDWSERTLDLVHEQVTAYASSKIFSWQLYATGNIGGWIVAVETGKAIHESIKHPLLLPAILIEATGIRGSLFTKERDFWSVSTPGLIYDGTGFLPVLPSDDGPLGRGWLNAKDKHLPLAQWLSNDKPEETAMDWIHAILADEILPLGDVAVSLARELLRNYLSDWPTNRHTRESLWAYFMTYAPRTTAWKYAARPKRVEIITSVGNSLCRPFPDWDSYEFWRHLRTL